MSAQNPFTAELQIQLRPSRLLLSFVLLTHISAALVVLILPGIALWLRCSGWALIVVSLVDFLLSHFAYRRDQQLVTMFWRESGGWEVVTGGGETLPVILSGSSFSSLYLTVLNVKTRKALGSRRYSVVLLPDNCDLATRRYLRMRMKLLDVKK